MQASDDANQIKQVIPRTGEVEHVSLLTCSTSRRRADPTRSTCPCSRAPRRGGAQIPVPTRSTCPCSRAPRRGGAQIPRGAREQGRVLRVKKSCFSPIYGHRARPTCEHVRHASGPTSDLDTIVNKRVIFFFGPLRAPFLVCFQRKTVKNSEIFLRPPFFSSPAPDLIKV